MKNTSGIIITDGEHILGCLPFGKAKKLTNNFDIPKGKIEDNESPMEAAVRECWEETGIRINVLDMRYRGMYQYNKKMIHIFVVKMKLPDVMFLNCISMIEKYGRNFPEMIDYSIIHKKDVSTKFYKSLVPIILSNI